MHVTSHIAANNSRKILFFDVLPRFLCVSLTVFFCGGCKYPAVYEESVIEDSTVYRITNPGYVPNLSDGLIVGGAFLTASPGAGMAAGVVGDYVYHALRKKPPKAKKQDFGFSLPSEELLAAYPRTIDPKFLARLDENRQIVAAPDPANTPTDSNSIPSSSLNSRLLWDTSLYYAIKKTSQDETYLPDQVKDLGEENVGALTYEIDTNSGSVNILPEAFESEPYTGRVILQKEENIRTLVAFINKGRLTEVGTLWDSNGTQLLARSQYDGLGITERAKEWDSNGTLIAEKKPPEPDPSLLSGIQPIPEGAILVSQSQVRGEFIYKRADDSKIENLESQIENATNPAEKTRLEGELLNLQLAAGTPFTGTVVEFWDEKRTQNKREEPVQVGKHNGTVTWWYENGKKQFEAEYLKGVPQGRTAWYREDETMEYEGFWENDKLLRASTWDATNQKTGDVTAGNGTLIYFHPNGQKRLEETFANGDLTATKWWDEEGNEVESASPSFIPAPPKLD